MLRVLAVAVISTCFVAAADAKCAMMGLAPEVLTPAGATIVPGGGIVVGVADAPRGDLGEGDASNQPGWRLRIGARGVTPTVIALAPGLSVYRVPGGTAGATLIDDRRATVGSIQVGTKTAVLAAPRVKRITYDSGQGRRPFAEVSVELVGGVPAGAIALVIADAKGKARSWGRVTTGKTAVLGYDRKRCRVLANGTVESRSGDKVTVFYVDASGRTSPRSRPFVIGAARAGAADPD